MKNVLLKLFLVLFASFAVLSCRKDDEHHPIDIHDHENIDKGVLKVVEKGTANTQTIDAVDGQSTKELMLEEGKTYVVTMDFLHKHDDHYHTMVPEIIKEKDEHFMTFEFGGSVAPSIKVVRTDGDNATRTDGNKLGLETEWTVEKLTGNSAEARIKLYHEPKNVNQNVPSADNQQGKANGETEFNVSFKIKEK